MQQLCVRDQLDGARAAAGEPLFFDFALCQSATRLTIPTNGEACASQTSPLIDWPEVEACVNGTQGPKLLDQSIAQMVPGTNDSISCTINLNSAFWCQHNEDWFGCTEGTTTDAFIASVCKRYTGPNPPPACLPKEGKPTIGRPTPTPAPRFALFDAKAEAPSTARQDPTE